MARVGRTPGILDDSVLEAFRTLQEDGQPDVVTELIDAFLADLPRRLDAIHQAVAAGVPAKIRSAAHALKGAACSLGAVRVCSLCAQLENLGRTGTRAGTAELGTAIQTEAAAIRAALLEYRTPRPPSPLEG